MGTGKKEGNQRFGGVTNKRREAGQKQNGKKSGDEQKAITKGRRLTAR